MPRERQEIKQIIGSLKDEVTDGVKSGMKQGTSTLNSNISDVLGNEMTSAIGSIKGILGPLTQPFMNLGKNILGEKVPKEEKKRTEDIRTLTDHATKKGSLYTHDIAIEREIEEMNNMYDSLFNSIDTKFTKAIDLTEMAADIRKLRRESIEEQTWFRKVTLGFRMFDEKYMHNVAKGTELTVNRLKEIRALISKQTGIAEKEVSIADKGRKMFLHALMSPIYVFSKPIEFMISRMKKNQDIEESYQDKSIRLLQGIHDHFASEAKRSSRQMDKKDKKGMGVIGVLAIAAFLIGGITRFLILPLEVLYLTLKTVSKFGLNLLKSIKKVKIFGKIFGRIGEILEPINMIVRGVFGKVFKFVGPFFESIGKIFTSMKAAIANSRFLGPLAEAFAKGFRILGWPLTIILGVVDFIRGYMSTEGTIVEKIKTGFISAIEGFFWLPIKLLNWIGSKLSFDGEIGTKFFGLITGAFSGIFDMFVNIFTGIKKFLSDPIKTSKEVISSVVESIANLFMSIINGIRNAVSKIPGLGWLAKKEEKAEVKYFKISPQGKDSAAKRADDIQKKKVTFYKIKEEEKKQEQQKMVDEDRKVKQEQTAAINQQTTVISQASQEQKAPAEEIPSEIDNYVLALATMEF